MHSQSGRLAQLVQSIWFTPRGSGVRIPHRPQDKAETKVSAFLFSRSVKSVAFVCLWEIKKQTMTEGNSSLFLVALRPSGITEGNPPKFPEVSKA